MNGNAYINGYVNNKGGNANRIDDTKRRNASAVARQTITAFLKRIVTPKDNSIKNIKLISSIRLGSVLPGLKT